MIFNKHNLVRVILLGFILLTVACSTTYKVEPELIQKFKPESVPTQEQTFVYVIRGSNFQGGARGAWVASNENVVAGLPNGSHVLLKLNAGINSLHMVQELVGFGYTRVDNRPGETIYYEIDYAKGEMKEISYELGVSMIMQTKKAKSIGEGRRNDAYDNLLVNPSLLGFSVMKETEGALTVDEKTAVINFYRMETLIGSVPFDIWSEDGFVGSTTSGTNFQIRVSPGKHTFLALSERYSVLEANVEAGKEYVVEFDVDMGWNQAHVQLLPVDVKKSAKSIKNWQAKAKLMAVDMDVVMQDEFQYRARLAEEYLSKQYEKVNLGDTPKRELDARHSF